MTPFLNALAGIAVGITGTLFFVTLSNNEPIAVPYKVVCLMPSQMGEIPTTKIILHDVQTRNRTSADVVGSDGSYRPMSGEVCFHVRAPEEEQE